MQYNDLRANIQSDLGGRTDLVPSLIDSEVAQRVNFYQTENFASQSTLDYSIVTTKGASIYPLPPYTIEVTGMWYLLGISTWIKLWPENFETLVELDDIQPSTQAPPNLYSVYGTSFKLFMTPDTQYPLRLACTKMIPPPVNDGDVNFWTQAGYSLIRWATDATLARGYLGIPSMGDEYDALASRELKRLNEFSEIIQSTCYIQPHMQ